MSDESLDLSNIINVSVLSEQAGLGIPNINTAALFTRETPSWDPDPFKIYTNATDVGTDFGTSSNAFKIASAFFAQQPNPLTTNGYLVIITLATAGAEKIQTAIARTLNSVFYFGVLSDQILSGSDLANLATYMQTVDKLAFYASATQADFAPGGMLDLVRQAGETHTRCLYYVGATGIDTQKMAAAYAGRALSTDFTGSNTAQTMHLKTLATIAADSTIDQTDLEAAKLAGVDIYINISGLIGAFTSGGNSFFDEVYNELWLKAALQVSGANYLKQTTTKIPQTEPGIEGLKNVYRQVCEQAVRNGFAGPGSWTSSTVFGDPAALIRNVAEIGYYVYSQPITQQLQADREARKAPLVQIAIKTQGAIHSSNVIVNVNL